MKWWEWALLLGAGGAAAVGLAAAARGAGGGSCTFADTDDGTTLTRTLTYQGSRTTPEVSGADVCLWEPLPAGELFYLQSADLLVDAPVAVDWNQSNFIYTKILNGQTYEAYTPNFEGLVNVHAPGPAGTYHGAGGPGQPVAGVDRWTQWSLPVPMTTSVRPQPGSGLARGNTSHMTLVYTHGGPIVDELRWTKGQALAAGDYSDSSPVIPDGTRGLVEITFAQADVDWTATVSRHSDGSSLLGRPSVGHGGQATGSYATAGHPAAVENAYKVYEYVDAGDYLDIDYSLLADGKLGWLVEFALLAA